MIQTKPDSILRSLSQYELNRFDKFLCGISTDEKTKSLWNYIRPFYKERTPEKIDKNQVWQASFQEQDFEAIKYARLLSDFTKILEKFLLLEHILADDINRTTTLMDIFNQRGLKSCILPEAKEAQALIEKKNFRDANYYYQKYQIDEQWNIYIENLDRRDSEKHISQTVKSLDIWYVIQKLKYIASVLHYTKFLNIPSEIYFSDEVLRFAGSPLFDDVPLVKIYVAILKTLTEADGSKAFTNLRGLLALHIALFPKEEAEQLYAFAVNYCIRQINNGDTEYLSHIFTLYKQMLNDGLLTYRGFISPWEYKNIVTVALRAKELDWAASFIKSQLPMLPEEDRQNAYTFNMARYAFAVGDYPQVLKLLSNVEYDDVFYQLDAKTTLMKTYFELSEYQALLSLRESFRLLLSRKKVISEMQRTVYNSFVRFTMKLFRADKKDKTKLLQLASEINASKQVADKSWLKEKVAALI